MKFWVTVSILCLPAMSYAHTTMTNLNMFSPNSQQDKYTVMESSDVLEKGEASFNLFGDAAFNTLAIYGAGGTISTNDSMNFLHFGAAYGLTSRLELGAKFPFLVQQSLSTGQVGRSIEMYDSGFTDAFLYLKYKISNSSKHGFALHGQFGQSFAENVFYNGDGPGMDYFLGAIYERMWETWSLVFNLGYVVRNPGEQGASHLFYEPIQKSMLASVGLSKRLNSVSALSAEMISTNNDFEIDQSDRDKLGLELNISYRRFWNKFIFVFGLGAGLSDGVSTPDYRGVIGVNYKFKPLGSSDSAPVVAVFKKKTVETPVAKVIEEKPAVAEVPPVEEKQVIAEDNPYKEKVYEEVVVLEKESEPAKKLEVFSQENQQSTNSYQKLVLEHIEFEFNSYNLDQSSLKILEGVMDYLRKTDYETLHVIGHTDFFGSVYYNEDLSLKRAKTVVEYLKQNGIDESKITFDGYGKRRPLKTGVSESYRRKNRRVEIILKKQ